MAVAELLAGGTLRLEAVGANDQLVFNDLSRRLGGKRWRFSRAILQPGQPVTFNPADFPPGTELGIVRPGRFRWPLEAWMTYYELSPLLLVSKKRLYNLTCQHKLERRIIWIGRGRARRRITHLPPASARRLAELTQRHHMIAPLTS